MDWSRLGCCRATGGSTSGSWQTTSRLAARGCTWKLRERWRRSDEDTARSGNRHRGRSSVGPRGGHGPCRHDRGAAVGRGRGRDVRYRGADVDTAEQTRRIGDEAMSEVGAKVDAFRSIADSAGKEAEAIRVRLLEVEKELNAAIRERDDAQAALARVLPRSCGAFAGPLTCARCTVSDQVLAEAERLDARRIDDLWRANEEQVRM